MTDMLESLREELGLRLADYRAADATETAHAERMRRLLETAAPFDRSRFVPGHFTASGFVVDPAGTHLAMIRHRKLQRWLQPGGHIERNDLSLAGAAAREIAEETGLSPAGGLSQGLLFDLDIHGIPPRPDEPGHLHFDLRWLFRAAERSPMRGEAGGEARWVELNEAVTLNPEPAMLRIVRKIERLLPS